MFKASVRLAEIMQKEKWEKKDLADKIGKSLSMVGLYLKRDRFSNAVLQSLFPLRELGYNIPDFFVDENAPMKIENKEAEKSVQAEVWEKIFNVIAELTQEVKRNSDLNEKLYQLLKSRK